MVYSPQYTMAYGDTDIQNSKEIESLAECITKCRSLCLACSFE